MASRILIVWPDEAHALELQQALQEAGLKTRVQTITRYPGPEELERLVSQSPPLAGAIVGLEGERAYELISNICSEHPRIAVAAAHAEQSADSLLAAMRAGAREFLTPPFAPETLRASFKEAVRSGDTGGTGSTIAFLPAQGGDGASTIAVHVGRSISADLGQPALLVDCDMHCGATAFRLGLEPKHDLSDALLRVENLEDLWDKIASRWKGLHVLPAPESGLRIDKPPADRLPEVLSAASQHYPYVIVDLPPIVAGPYEDVLHSSDLIYLVCSTGLPSLHLARRKASELQRSGVDLERVRLLMSRVDARTPVRKVEVEKAVGLRVEWVLPDDPESVSKAILEGAAVRNDSTLGGQLAKLAHHIAGAEEEVERKPSGWKRILGF